MRGESVPRSEVWGAISGVVAAVQVAVTNSVVLHVYRLLVIIIKTIHEKTVLTSSLTNHVVRHSIGVNSDTCGSTRLNHSSQLSPGSHSRVQSVRNRLVNKVPRPELVIRLVVVASPDVFSGGPNLDTHVPSLSKERTLRRNIIVWPSKQLNNTTLLSVAEGAQCSGQCRILPDEVQRLKHELLSTGGSDGDSKSRCKRRRNLEGIAGLRVTTEVIGQGLSCPARSVDDNHSSSATGVVLDISISNQVPVVLESRNVCGIALRGSLPAAVL